VGVDVTNLCSRVSFGRGTGGGGGGGCDCYISLSFLVGGSNISSWSGKIIPFLDETLCQGWRGWGWAKA